YWRNMEPEIFTSKPQADDQREHRGAILYGYQRMDALLGRLIEMANGNTTLVFATALSQQPCLKFEDIGGKSYYRPRDFQKFIAPSGLPPAKAAPVMSHEFHLEFESEADAERAEARLRGVTIREQRGFNLERTGREMLLGCRIWEVVPEDTLIS